jgi:hemerythrin
MAITWQTSLFTGIQIIDDQHKEIFYRFDSFYDACDHGAASKDLGRLLRYLKQYTETHFHDEEDYMAGALYPEFGRHKELHRSFIREISLLDKEIGEGVDVSLSHILTTKRILIRWFIQHIRLEDRNFAAFMAEQNL